MLEKLLPKVITCSTIILNFKRLLDDIVHQIWPIICLDWYNNFVNIWKTIQETIKNLRGWLIYYELLEGETLWNHRRFSRSRQLFLMIYKALFYCLLNWSPSLSLLFVNFRAPVITRNCRGRTKLMMGSKKFRAPRFISYAALQFQFEGHTLDSHGLTKVSHKQTTTRKLLQKYKKMYNKINAKV